MVRVTVRESKVIRLTNVALVSIMSSIEVGPIEAQDNTIKMVNLVLVAVKLG
jgi:hypothetical protein